VGESIHVPVMLNEVLTALKAQEGGTFLDCTLGGAGHTKAILAANPNNIVFAIDRDLDAVRRARENLADEIKAGRLMIEHASFSDLSQLDFSCLKNGLEFRGILADLGLSSDQLAASRGFSFHDEGVLDMRMDQNSAYSANEVVNLTSEKELFAILKRGGVGNEARRIVREIINARPIRNTSELAEVVRRVAMNTKGFDPSTVAFQAIRIEVNQEYSQILDMLNVAIKLLSVGGRLAVISFHSLEDKLVAKEMRRWVGADSTPANWPGSHMAVSLGMLLTKKALLPTAEEIERNTRSRSARLRVFEKNS